MGIYLHRNAIARNGPKVTFADANVHKASNSIACNGPKVTSAHANVHKASNSIARNGVTSFNVQR